MTNHFNLVNFLSNFLAFLIFFSPALFAASKSNASSASEAGGSDNEAPFTYFEGTGKGPKEWGLINPKYHACANGQMQSPIDILSQKVLVLPSLGRLRRDYKSAPATIKNRGHDIMVKWKANAGEIKINGTVYKLLQCHWHTPSEHTFNGSRYPLELHVVHLSSRGEIAVIGILYKYGRPDPFLSRLFHHIKSVGKEERELGIVNPGDIKFGSRKYYRYMGSLTVPPCSEGVVWTIVKKVRTVSRKQVKALKDAVDDAFRENARPTQPSYGRPVFLCTPSNSGGPP